MYYETLQYIWINLIFSFFLLIGCGGGAVDNIPIKNNPQSNVTLSGYVVEGTQNSVRTSSELRYSLGNNLSGINVFLENNNTLRGITDNSGKFIIENVPEGYHSIIAEKKEAGAIIYRQRLRNINIKGIDNYYELPEPISILPSPYLLTLLITNTKNQPIKNAKIFLWGRDYFSDSDGLVSLTDFPNLSDEEATISASGYKTTKIKLSFGETLNSKIFVKLSQTSDNNSAPIVEIKYDSNSSIIKENNKLYISANKQLLLTSLGNDPDGNSNKISWNWSADKGSFSGLTTAKEVTYSSPSISGEVTITLIGKDEKGLEGKAELKLVVRGGSDTETLTNTQTSTNTNTNTNTSTNTRTNTSTNTQTQTQTDTNTATSTNTSTNTNTNTTTSTNTLTDSQTQTDTNTNTNTQTATETTTQTSTSSNTETQTSTSTNTQSQTNTETTTQTNIDTEITTQLLISNSSIINNMLVVEPVIAISFDKSITSKSIIENSIKVIDENNNSYKPQMSWENNQSTLIISFTNKPLKTNTIYKISMLDGLKDSNGNIIIPFAELPFKTLPFSGNGTTDNPFEISNASQLDNVRLFKNYAFKVINDINISPNNYSSDNNTEENGWNPIGNSFEDSFKGYFDGNNKTISGLTINTSNNNVGLFGYTTDGAYISNIIISSDSTIIGNRYVAAIVGYNYKSTIYNCKNYSNINGKNDDSYSGSITGFNDNSKIYNCVNYGTINGKSLTGGIAGGNGDNSEIVNCSNNGFIQGSDYVGGISGANTYFIGKCENKGEINGNENVGGITGLNKAGIVACRNLNNVKGANEVGGICGCSLNKDNGEFPYIGNCYCYSNVTSTSSPISGGLVGTNIGTINNCYFVGLITHNYAKGSLTGVNSDYSEINNCFITSNSQIYLPAAGITGSCSIESGTYNHILTNGYKEDIVYSSWSDDSTWLDNTIWTLSDLKLPELVDCGAK